MSIPQGRYERAITLRLDRGEEVPNFRDHSREAAIRRAEYQYEGRKSSRFEREAIGREVPKRTLGA